MLSARQHGVCQEGDCNVFQILVRRLTLVYRFCAPVSCAMHRTRTKAVHEHKAGSGMRPAWSSLSACYAGEPAVLHSARIPLVTPARRGAHATQETRHA